MWWPTLTRHTLRLSKGNAGGEKVLTWRRGDDAEIVYNATVTAAFVGRWARRNWVPLFVTAAAGVSLWQAGLLVTGLLTAGAAAALIGWRIKWPDSYEHHVASSVRGWWRCSRIYRKPWQSTMENRNLAMDYGEVRHIPAIRKVVTTRYTDQLLVAPVNGQPIEDFEKNTSGFARTFKAQRCRVRQGVDGEIWLDFYQRDALAALIPALPPADEPNLKALPIGKTEFGEPWTLQLLGSHVFVVGATGAGKGSVVWSTIRAMGPLVANGTVRLWVIDPKGGMELGIGEPLFFRFAHDLDAGQELLAEAVEVMHGRAARLRAAERRLHEPTQADPFDVVIVDELANLTAYDKSNTTRQRRTQELIQLLLSQGRAPGVSVMAAAQDPAKEVIGFRHLFPATVALRLQEDQQVKMVLGEGARQRGAECDKIGPSQQGVGYVALEGVREPQRVRAAYVADDDIKDMCRRYAPGTVSNVVPLPVAS